MQPSDGTQSHAAPLRSPRGRRRLEGATKKASEAARHEAARGIVGGKHDKCAAGRRGTAAAAARGAGGSARARSAQLQVEPSAEVEEETGPRVTRQSVRAGDESTSAPHASAPRFEVLARTQRHLFERAAASLEDDDTEEVAYPDDTRPAVPDVQQLQALPLYALLAQLESGPGNNYESDLGLTTIDPMLSHLNIQDCVTRDCLVEQDENETEVKDKVNAKDTTLSVHKNLEMCVLDTVPKDSVNERVEATTGTQDNMNATVGVQDLGKHKVTKLGALDDINTANESIGALDTNEETTDCDSEEKLQFRLNALRS